MAKFRGASVGTGVNPVSNATADLDGDGNLDLLLANYISDNLSVALNNGNGTFAAATTVASGGARPVQTVIADFDGDGNADLVVAEFNGSTASILLNSGEGFIDISAASATGTIANDDRATVSDSTDNDYLADIGKLALLLG